MNNFLNTLEIKNFKSIKELKANCKRVNVFIGKPNVGKSNILEAIGLFGVSYSQNQSKFISEFVRYEEISNLFYDDDLLQNIEVNTDKAHLMLRFHSNNINQAELFIAQHKDTFNHLSTGIESIKEIKDEFQRITQHLANKVEIPFIQPFYVSMYPNGAISGSIPDIISSQYNPIKKYHFKNAEFIANKFPKYLLPPFGDNLFSIVDHNKQLRKEIVEIFSEYGLQFVASKKESKFEIQKNIDGYITNFHYSSIADTFQRLIFYFAAIDSNKNSVLILEEPEVHSFPPYTKELAERIVNSTDNQFFITTHSPYLLQHLISNLDNSELNVFITYFEDYHTQIKQLSSEELSKASEFGVDLFYNLNQFVTNA